MGPRRPLPGALPDRLLESLLATDPWMHHGHASRACSVKMADGTVHARVHVTVVDEFDDAWAAGFGQLSQERAVPVGDIATIEPSPHALPAELATKAMHGEEWRMGAYRYAVVLWSGEAVTLVDSGAIWLPDSIDTSDIADVIPNPGDDYPPGGPIPKPWICYTSTPQTAASDRDRYEEHFAEAFRIAADLSPYTALADAHQYAASFPLRERPLAYAAMTDRLTTGVSRYERFMGDDIDLLARFAEREGHCDVPRGHIEGGRRLNADGLALAIRTGSVADQDIRRLEAIPGWQAAADSANEKLLTPERAHKMAEEHAERRRRRIETARQRARDDESHD